MFKKESDMFKRPNTPTTPVTPVVPVTPIASNKYWAYNFGLNDYPGSGNDLQGCCNDATEWCNLLRNEYKYNVNLFKDSEVTSKNFKFALEDLVAKSGEGTHGVITYSGHGSNVPDKDLDEPDKRDECICLYDRFFIDDEIKVILKNLHPMAKLTFISDSCHSGSISRNFLSTTNLGRDYIKARYLPPLDDQDAAFSHSGNIVSRIFDTEDTMNEIVITGCLATEYSYDAFIGGSYMGAMSYYATNILKKTPTISYNEFHKKLRMALPSSQYPQTPLLEGKDSGKQAIIFS